MINIKDRFLTIRVLSHKYAVKLLCNIANVSRSSYYKLLNRENNDNSSSKTENKILEIYNKSKRVYGYRHIKIALLREFGLVINRKKIIRLMRKLILLPKYGIIQSMSSRRNCLDNACIENFFG